MRKPVDWEGGGLQMSLDEEDMTVDCGSVVHTVGLMLKLFHRCSDIFYTCMGRTDSVCRQAEASAEMRR